jgi:hypothetical protein
MVDGILIPEEMDIQKELRSEVVSAEDFLRLLETEGENIETAEIIPPSPSGEGLGQVKVVWKVAVPPKPFGGKSYSYKLGMIRRGRRRKA